MVANFGWKGPKYPNISITLFFKYFDSESPISTLYSLRLSDQYVSKPGVISQIIVRNLEFFVHSFCLYIH